MTFLNLGIGAWTLGLLGIAGILFLLQRLRVKYREVEVVTTMFWKQAVEETRARILMRRFRHLLSFLLALAIATLIWLAFAEPRIDEDEEGDYVLLLDASAGMNWGTRFESAKNLMQQEAKRLPAERRRVFLCGADARLVLDRGEEAFLLDYRLRNREPELAPSSVERELLSLSASEPGNQSLTVFIVGDAPVSGAVLEALPSHIQVKRLREEERSPLQGNSGIAGIGVAEAASGAFDRVDIMLDLNGGGESPDLTFKIGEQELARKPQMEEGRFFLRDLPANGEVFTVELNAEDEFQFDDLARIRLPDRPALTVFLDEDADPHVRMVVQADPGLSQSVEGGAALVLIGKPSAPDQPAMELVEGNTITIVHQQELSPAKLRQTRDRFEATGLDRIGRNLGATPETDAPKPPALVMELRQGEARKIQIGRDLLGANYDFAQSSALPLFVSAGVRWIAGAESIEPYVRAGEHLALSDRLSIAGSRFAPPRVAEYETRDGNTVIASLPSPRTETSRGADAIESLTSSADGGRWPALVSWIMLTAMVLIGAEWWFFQKGRIP